MNRWLLLGIGVLVTLVAGFIVASQVMSGSQPWGETLTDNMVFARMLPFILGLGVVFGMFRALAQPTPTVERRTSDGAVRRFAPGTALMHWVTAVGFLLGMVTGSWQYLKGVLDVESPINMALVYRVHYIGASVLLFAVAMFTTYWLLRGDKSLMVPKGQWIRNLRGLAHELPRPLGATLAGLIGLNLRRAAPGQAQFTFYERVISFPSWTILIVAIAVTGLLKAMRYIYPIPGDLLWWASFLHVAIMVLLAAKLLDHMRYVFAPSRYPLLISSFTTWVSEKYARTYHPDWVETPSEATEPRPEAAPPPAPRPGTPVPSGQTAP